MEDLTENKFVEYLKEIFATPEPGSEKMMISGGYFWKWVVGKQDSLRVSDNCLEWRTPTPYEMDAVRKVFGIGNTPAVK